MPELGDQMYCSEQICIPPAFPYLLRQFAKAAIRTQPTDLLRWSTAYFRCLSLNIPPPVKPRLEYPIPRDHCGLTPGWLKALMYQLQNNLTVPFKILWDRWTGACLEHNTLTQILCLGGFNDPEAIPWSRFIGLCAAHLTDSLTQTMILACEVMTEEPEGGSAMIPLETFLDLYTFLATIDASQPQVLKNEYFSDALLALWKKTAAKDEGSRDEVKEESMIEEESAKSEVVEEIEEEVTVQVDSKDVISCPSIAGDDDYNVDYHVDQEKFAEQLEEAGAEEMQSEGEGTLGTGVFEEAGEGDEQTTDVMPVTKLCVEEQEQLLGEGDGEEAESKQDKAKEEEAEVLPKESVDTIQETPRHIEPDFIEDDRRLKEDLERLQILQTELNGESDVEIEKFKCRLIEEMPLTTSQKEAVQHFKDVESKSDMEVSGDLRSEGVEEEEEEEDVEKIEKVYVDVVPGIGPVVPQELMQTVCKYMKGVAALQQGMVMPRNIRHYNCPPLEVVEI
ncbi:hypothetical protein NQ315_002392 [Exocentrus adspersus]|uniref:Uncharacterized protein n=1 Tax=Exocentrus adspersus TaxID=1586481 RepID=A0AAV8VSS9_9CUCU|nr:hypothetical protein NQ315_002392 [Exocentrus adspersus]